MAGQFFFALVISKLKQINNLKKIRSADDRAVMKGKRRVERTTFSLIVIAHPSEQKIIINWGIPKCCVRVCGLSCTNCSVAEGSA